VLVIARVCQGVAGALLMPGSLAILAATFDETRRGRAIGTWSGWSAISTAAGQVAGGLLAQYASWRWIFLINLPLALAVVAISWRCMDESRDPQAPPGLDWAGAALAVTGLGTLTYGMLEGSPAAIVGGLVVLGGFVAWEARAAAPLLPLDVFRNRTFSGVNALTLLLYGALGGMMFLLPFNLVQVQGYPQTAAGLAMLPVVGVMWLFSGRAGALADRAGPRLPLVLGPAIVAIGFGLLAIPGAGGSYWLTFFPGMVVFAGGMTMVVAPLTTAVMNAVPGERAGLASGVNNAVARLAGLVAIGVFGAVLLAGFRWELARRGADPALLAHSGQLMALDAPRALLVPAFVLGFRLAMALAALLALLGAGLAAISLPRGRKPV
jgi:predicted MFS family arabinose efflux permease